MDEKYPIIKLLPKTKIELGKTYPVNSALVKVLENDRGYYFPIPHDFTVEDYNESYQAYECTFTSTNREGTIKTWIDSFMLRWFLGTTVDSNSDTWYSFGEYGPFPNEEKFLYFSDYECNQIWKASVLLIFNNNKIIDDVVPCDPMPSPARFYLFLRHGPRYENVGYFRMKI